MSRALRRAKKRPHGAAECEALQAEIIRGLCTVLSHGYPQDYDFGVHVEKLGSKFKVSYHAMEYPPSNPITGEYDEAYDTEGARQMADEEYEVAHDACNALTAALTGEPFADNRAPYGVALECDRQCNEYLVGTKEQFMAALNAAFKERRQPAIANPLLTASKER